MIVAVMSPPAWAFQPDHYEKDPPEDLICSICRSVLCHPTECECRHVFCSECIHKWVDMYHNCPVCRTNVSKDKLRPAHHIVINLIGQLIVRCKNRTNGCTARVKVENAHAHMLACTFEMVDCPMGCKKRMLRKHVEFHKMKDCSFRTCKICEVKLQGDDNHNCLMVAITELRKSNLDQKKQLEENQQSLNKLKESFHRVTQQLLSLLSERGSAPGGASSYNKASPEFNQPCGETGQLPIGHVKVDDYFEVMTSSSYIDIDSDEELGPGTDFNKVAEKVVPEFIFYASSKGDGSEPRRASYLNAPGSNPTPPGGFGGFFGNETGDAPSESVKRKREDEPSTDRSSDPHGGECLRAEKIRKSSTGEELPDENCPETQSCSHCGKGSDKSPEPSQGRNFFSRLPGEGETWTRYKGDEAFEQFLKNRVLGQVISYVNKSYDPFRGMGSNPFPK